MSTSYVFTCCDAARCASVQALALSHGGLQLDAEAAAAAAKRASCLQGGALQVHAQIALLPSPARAAMTATKTSMATKLCQCLHLHILLMLATDYISDFCPVARQRFSHTAARVIAILSSPEMMCSSRPRAPFRQMKLIWILQACTSCLPALTRFPIPCITPSASYSHSATLHAVLRQDAIAIVG